MATLYNTRISDTYVGLIKTIDNAAISATLRELTDGSGNGTGLSLNNAGDFKVNAILEFGSLKDTGENIVISKFVDAADGIGNNNNDTSIPTTKAIIDYVAGQITAEDLDFRGDDSTVLGDVDLNSQAFIILGTANEIETSVTSAGGNTLQIGIPSNPVLTGIVTATTFSGNLTGNVTGNVTGDLTGNVTATSVLANGVTATTQASSDNSTKVATTAYVKGLDNASDLDFKGDNGTAGDVNLNTQRFDILGTTNQITTVSSGQSLTIGMPTNITISGIVNATTFNGDLNGTINTATTAVTQSAGDNSTKVATTAYVDTLDAASDLDITDGSNTGDVNLNTQSLSILGTSQQVTSTVSNQSVTLSLPSSINVNSASATILQNARDISLTGEASATISSFNGSANVSGAVTLDNDSVTGKVLTGLASPTATNILASDSILQAFGKTQSQLNTLAGGLRFMGTWNATTNSPTLASGGGESASGTTTGTTANKLVDSSGSFTSAVDGDKVVNQASGATATVTNVDSSTVLSLSADIMVSGQEYTIDNSPYITQGHYFVVSVGGTSSLNGLSNWAVGDWVIAGAGNVWEKLDHTQVDGTGTVGNITKWSSTNVIADSIMAESGSTITATGSIAATQLLSSGGNFAVNTDKFTVNATTGNVVVAGSISVASGTISVLGGNNMTLAGPASHGGISFATNSILPATASATNDNVFDLGATAERFKDLYLGGSITAGGAATFSGDVTSNNITAPAGFLGGSNGGIRIHSGGTKFFNITAANAARDGIMDIGASDARFKSLYLSGTINSNGAANFEDTIIIEKPQLTNQFDTSSFLRLHPSSTTNSNGYTNMFFGTSTSNNYGVAIGAVRAGTGDTSSNNNPDFVVRILNDSITGTEVLKIDSSSKAHFAGDVAINGATGITGLNGITFENGCILDDSIGAEYLKLKYNGASAGGLQVFDNQNRVQGYLYASGGATSEFGLLNGAGQWGVRTTEGAGTALFYGASSEKLTTTNVGVTFSNLSNTSAASSSVDEVKIGSFGAGRPAIYFGTSNTTYTNSTWFIENIGAAGKLRIGRNGLDIVEIFNDGNTSFAGNLIIHDTSNAPYIDFVESGATSDSKARITMDQIDTDNASLLFATENAGTLYNQVKITQTGNLLLSNDAAAFNTSNAKLNIQPASSGVYTQWNYSNTNETFALKLKETVTSGNVRYVFEQNNNGTTYSNALVFNEGKIGIGTQDPRARGLEIFRAAGLSSTPQLIIATGESGSEDYSLSTDVTAAGDFCIVKGAANVAANVRMKINSSGDISIGGNVNKGKLTVDTSSGNNITIRKGTGQAALAYGGTNADEAVALVEGKAGGGLKWYNGTGTLASPTWTAGMELYDNGRLHPYGGVFLGSSNNSNLLDDYEEGTFTPVLKDLGGNPATLSTAIGTYTKIGRQVIFNYDVRMSSKASMTGNYVHLSLPFNHAASISGTGTVDKFNNMTTAFSSMAWDVTSTVTVAWLVGVEGTSATNSVYVTVAELSDTSKFKGTIIYHT